MIKPKELIDLLKVKPAKLAMHKFNDGHTAKTFDNLVNNLNVNSILKICNFSENYMLLPEEIQSFQWVQETATVYPIAVMGKVGNEIRES